MLTKLSSKGQLIIPKLVRQALSLEPGAQFQVEVVDKKIVLKPVSRISAVDRLYGKYAGEDMLGALENEHRQEVQDDNGLPA
jgi:AbrB family looped-hinge helix DNA binding protein